jgi:hypothetical protein
MKNLYITAVLLLSGVLSLPSMASSKVLELGHEASTAMVELPTSENGELLLRTCTACTALRLRASADTRYQVGRQLLSLADFRKYLKANPNSGLVVMQFRGSNSLSRVLVQSPGLAQ